MLRLLAMLMLLVSLAPDAAIAGQRAAEVEPQAAHWHTWLLTSASQLRPAPPPDAEAAQSELDQLHMLATR